MFFNTLIAFLTAVACASSCAALARPGASAYTLGLREPSWNDVVQSLRDMPQRWTNAGPYIRGRSDFTFDIGCTAAGATQRPDLVDIPNGVHTWFSGADTGPTCDSNLANEVICAAAQNPSQDGCGLNGSYAVWNTGIMDCFAFDALEQAVINTCADSDSGDCGCGVYSDFGSGKCLVATWTYHLSGPSVFDISGDGPGVPSPVNVSINHARDELGPSYTDLSVCATFSFGDIETWCEGSATHVC